MWTSKVDETFYIKAFPSNRWNTYSSSIELKTCPIMTTFRFHCKKVFFVSVIIRAVMSPILSIPLGVFGSSQGTILTCFLFILPQTCRNGVSVVHLVHSVHSTQCGKMKNLLSPKLFPQIKSLLKPLLPRIILPILQFPHCVVGFEM